MSYRTATNSLTMRTAWHPRRLDCSASRQGFSASPSPCWCPYEGPLLWKGDESRTINECENFSKLSAPWKVMLLSDGSVTRHLKLMTGMEVAVECLEMRQMDRLDTAANLPDEVSLLHPPMLQRQVLLRLRGSEASQFENGSAPLVYAASWWNATAVSEYLKDSSLPIWASLSKERLELYRDIRDIYYGDCPHLEDMFNSKGPFWGRDYVFWHNQEPLTVIHEVFSNALSEYLGSMGECA